jgi:hypothetical protein
VAAATAPVTYDAGTKTVALSIGTGLTTSSGSLALAAHKSTHATGGSDALTASDIGASAVGHTHSAQDVSGLAAVATSGAYSDLTGRPTLGTAAAAAATDFAAASHAHGNITNAGVLTGAVTGGGGGSSDPDFANVSLLLSMDGNGNTFVDTSGTPKTITAYGGATQSTAQSQFGGKSAYFDGSGDYLSLPFSSAFSPVGSAMTIECWLRPDNAQSGGSSGNGNAGAIVSLRTGAVLCGYEFSIRNDKTLQLLAYDGSFWAISIPTAASATALVTDQWSHVALVITSTGSTTLYINGVADASFSNINVPYAANGSDTTVFIGVGGDGFYRGYIDDLRITKAVRYASNFTPPTAPFPFVAPPVHSPLVVTNSSGVIVPAATIPATAVSGLESALAGKAASIHTHATTDITGLGTIATQAANSVAITGGSINGTTIGASTASTGAFTTLRATGVVTIPAGTATAPSVTISGDTNTGLAQTGGADSLSIVTGGVERLRVGADGATRSVIPGGSTLLPDFACRAWVNFDGTAASNLSGTYSQTGTTVTVTATAHGLAVGQAVFLDFTTGTATDAAFTVATVPNANSFTVTRATATTSGNVTIVRNTIRASGNVSSIADNGVGNYTINFATAMPDTNYSLVVTVGHNDNGQPVVAAARLGTVATNHANISTNFISASGASVSSAGLFDFSSVNIAVFR